MQNKAGSLFALEEYNIVGGITGLGPEILIEVLGEMTSVDEALKKENEAEGQIIFDQEEEDKQLKREEILEKKLKENKS
ncbi:MAG: hypothetical protein EZS28_002161 [Streblomastix strix]|uniref:Uncharacterized protein n=1 Tax=Streblomastix strix TaxID=222440 RepID=A0A5J4X676_9EUKA|nr:MAG: hypothetical protein EZS28_002161 [Streblomastix strix]